ncbi:hypothetical protein AB5I41_06605 [Sphingomonas sp. MMS24-JH45]
MDEPVKMPMFIGRDRPVHTAQRRTVAPAFTPSEMQRMSGYIRRRTGEVLDTVPIGGTFDWVDTVSIELTTQMLAILFDFPWEDRRKLTEWSDWMGDIELFRSEEMRKKRLEKVYEVGAYFRRLWNERLEAEPAPDLIDDDPFGRHARDGRHGIHGQLDLAIVGGNDTTRNTMSGSPTRWTAFPTPARSWRRTRSSSATPPARSSAGRPRWRTWRVPRRRIPSCTGTTSARANNIRDAGHFRQPRSRGVR